MTRPKADGIDPPANRPTGFGGRVWDAERMHTTNRAAVVGRMPERPNSFTDVIEIRFSSRGVDATELARRIARDLMAQETTEETK